MFKGFYKNFSVKYHEAKDKKDSFFQDNGESRWPGNGISILQANRLQCWWMPNHLEFLSKCIMGDVYRGI